MASPMVVVDVVGMSIRSATVDGLVLASIHVRVPKGTHIEAGVKFLIDPPAAGCGLILVSPDDMEDEG